MVGGKPDNKNYGDKFHEPLNNVKPNTEVLPNDITVTWNPLGWDYRDFICGWTAAFINICITYPVNKITFRQMLHNISPLVALKQVSNEGIFVLYRGILPPLCQKTTSLSLMFGVYEGMRKPISEILPQSSAKAGAAVFAGAAEAVLAPFERVQTLLQDRKYQSTFKNTSHAFKEIHAKYGVREFFRGLVPILLRNCPSNVLYFSIRDFTKERFSDKATTWYGKLGTEFLSGGAIGGLLSTIFYPFNVLKVHMQSKLGGKFQNILSATKEVYVSRGRRISGFYRGVHLNYTRGFFSWGIIMVSSETMRRLIY